MPIAEEVCVSVIIPVYNGADTIGRAIQSVFAQDYRSYELIVVDDGSTDSTADVVRGFGSQVQYIRQENRGPAAARNAGARLARGEYLAFLDADDWWKPGALSKLSRALDEHAEASLAFCDFTAVDDVGNWEVHRAGAAPSMGDLLARGWPILTSAALLRREFFHLSGGFCEELRIPGFEDPYMWLLMREHGEFEYVRESLMIYAARPFVERTLKYEPARRIFDRLVRRRYGKRARGLARAVRATYANAFLQKALSEIDRGEFRAAVKMLVQMIRTDPFYIAKREILGRVLCGRNLQRLFRPRALS